MTKYRTGSMCFTDLQEAAKGGHSAFSRAKNGKVYFNYIRWMNEENQFGQDGSFQLQSKKEKQDQDAKIYFGNEWAEKDRNDTIPGKEPVKTTMDESDGLPF